MPSFVSAAEYICRCSGCSTTFFNDWPSCESGCGNDCKTGQAPSCVEIKAGTNPDSPSCGQTPGSSGQTKTVPLTNPLGKDVTIQVIIGRVINAVLGIVGSIALLMFIYGGFLWLTSGGSTEKITKGKQVLVWATIGLAIIFLSYTLVGFVIKGLTSAGTPTGGGGGGGGGCCSTSVTCFNVTSEEQCKSTGASSNKFFPGTKCDSGNTGACI